MSNARDARLVYYGEYCNIAFESQNFNSVFCNSTFDLIFPSKDPTLNYTCLTLIESLDSQLYFLFQKNRFIR